MKADHIPTMAVAVVSHNTRELLHACLESVRSSFPGRTGEVMVVDNASTDGSAEMVEAEYAWVTLLRNEANTGYGTAANQAMAACTARYVLLLNSDTILQPGALQSLAAYLDDSPRVAIVGPRLVNSDGSLQPSCNHFPIPSLVFCEFSNVYRLIRRIPILRARILQTWSHAIERPVPWVLGAALAIRREAFEEVGGFDESFFMYFEEVDLCYRLAKAGWQVHFAPATEIAHVGGASARQRRAEMDMELFRSLGLFYRRHYSRARLVELAVLVECIALARLVRDTLLLRLAEDPMTRASLANNVAAWKRLLLGQWHGQRMGGEHVRLG